MTKKISIIMPTYNDSNSIIETLNTIINQQYINWELIIVDDGSTDKTKKVIENYKKQKDKENKIQYIYQSNQDQLNAILNGVNYITGDYVFILHSDDLLNDNTTLQKCVTYMELHPTLDAIISNLVLINENGATIGVQNTRNYSSKEYIIPLLGLWLGRNLYVDVAFYKKETFISKVKTSYLTWNMPFWLDLSCPGKKLKIKNIDFPFIKYRISPSNYINNEIGKLNVINGELRTLTSILCNYNIVFYKFQYFFFRAFNKIKIPYIPFYTHKRQQKIGSIIEFAIEKRFNNEYKNNVFLFSLSQFFNNLNNRSIEIDSGLLEKFTIYYGKDMREFNNNLIRNNLDDIYYKLFEEMKIGFSEIIVKTIKDKEKMEIITKFLCIYPFIKITIQGE